MRDSQRSKVYAAEHEAGFKCSDERELQTVKECLQFVQSALNNVWVRIDFGNDLCKYISGGVGISETRRRNRATAREWNKSILLPYRNWAWNQTTLLHELAHIITYWCWKPYWVKLDSRSFAHRGNIAAHGPEFCCVYLRLLRHCGIPNEWALMQRLFQLHHVRFYTAAKSSTERRMKWHLSERRTSRSLSC